MIFAWEWFARRDTKPRCIQMILSKGWMVAVHVCACPATIIKRDFSADERAVRGVRIQSFLVLHFAQYNCGSWRNVEFSIPYTVKLFDGIMHMSYLIESAVFLIVAGETGNQFLGVGIDRDQDVLQRIGRMEVEYKEQILTSKAQRLLRCLHQLQIGHCLIKNSVLLT